MDKTLGQLTFEAHLAFYNANALIPTTNTSWDTLSPLQRNAMEAGAAAVRDATLDQCTKIAQCAREGEIDGDWRSIKSRIQGLKTNWHDEDGKY